MTPRSATILIALAAGPFAIACGTSDDSAGSAGSYGFATGPMMLPGENCLRCHSERSPYPEAPVWTAGGTVYPTADAPADMGVNGAIVEITDSAGKTITLTTNAAGNFYTREPLTAPLRVALAYEGKRAEMPIEAPAGSCNACHSHPDPTGGTKGRIRTADVRASTP